MPSNSKTAKQYAFVPRCVITKQVVSGNASKKLNSLKSPNINSLQVGNTYDDTEKESESVKQYSIQQRWPDTNEPVCVICGKYGEYICDQTDEDVCSMECKQKHLSQVKKVIQEKDMPTNNRDPLNDFNLFYMKHGFPDFSSKYDSEQLKFFREKFKIKLKCTKDPGLIFNFSECNFNEILMANLEKNDFLRPTLVQMQTIPACLSGQDVLVSAPTTSGKTASFLLPILQKTASCLGCPDSSNIFHKYPIAMILSPTRELAIQIEDQFKALAQQIPNMKSALLIGGVPLPQQLHRMKHNIQIVIGTPGRIIEVLSKHEDVLILDQIKMVVLDEVDVMLHMGFQNQIQQIVTALPNKPQYMMFSATIPDAIENLSSSMMANPVYISIGLSGVPNQSVKQLVIWVEDKSKRKKLFSIIDDRKHFLAPALIFVDSKIGADMLCDAINQRYRIRCESLHSDKSQDERTSILENFRNGLYNILVSTNVLGRGIELQNVRQVIIFDMSNSIDEYVHQVGRAGNLNQLGFSICFINNSSKRLFLDFKEMFDVTKTKLPEELLKSPYIVLEREKREKMMAKTFLSNKRPFSSKDDDHIDSQSLIEILTKKRFKRKK